ncbi:LppP/LprE family lipoprotein [Leucobacter albus]
MVLPACDRANPSAEAEQAAFLASFGADRVTASYGESDRALLDEFSDEATRQALAAVRQERSCNWVVYLDSVYLYQFTAELTAAAIAQLAADLRAAEFTESNRGPATSFTRSVATGDMRGTIAISHTLVGNAWIVLIENTVAAYEQSALDAFLGANPRLADEFSMSCVDRGAEAAIAAAVTEISPVEQAAELAGPPANGGWDVAGAAARAESTFDACLPLSWAVLPAAAPGADGASTAHLLLFHFEDFIGTATPAPTADEPLVSRLSKHSITARAGGVSATPGGASPDASLPPTTFTWDTQARELTREAASTRD